MGDGHAGQRRGLALGAARIGGAGLGQGEVGVDVYKGVQVARGVDAGEVVACEFLGGNGARRQGIGDLAQGSHGISGKGHVGLVSAVAVRGGGGPGWWPGRHSMTFGTR
ncbi:hypothetical protein D3C72_1575560 [compost metagenome]